MKNRNETELLALLDSLHSRRDFLKLFARGLGYSALAGSLPGCGGGSGGSAPPTIAQIPAPSAEYTVLKRTSFGVRRDELDIMQSIGINTYLEQQLDSNMQLMLQQAGQRVRFSAVKVAHFHPDQILARTVAAPVEIPVGLLTAIVGAPVFLWFLTRAGKSTS